MTFNSCELTDVLLHFPFLVLYGHIVGDIKRHNATRKNVGLNKSLQNFMYEMLQDESEIAQVKIT